MTNIDPDVADQIYKLFSMILCANTLGQAGSWFATPRQSDAFDEGAMASILNPPVEGDASFALFSQEGNRVTSLC